MGTQSDSLGHDISGTAYDIRGSIESDEHADEMYNSELSGRMNLRIPEWMEWDLESVADSNRMKRSEAARALIERALGEWGPYQTFGVDEHTYGDCKCPRCANENPASLRWERQEDVLSGVKVTCNKCEFHDDVMLFRRMEQMSGSALENIWLVWALRVPDMDEYQPTQTVSELFREFVSNPDSLIDDKEIWNEDEEARKQAREQLTETKQTGNGEPNK